MKSQNYHPHWLFFLANWELSPFFCQKYIFLLLFCNNTSNIILVFFSCPLLSLSFSLVRRPRVSFCLWTSVNWMWVLGPGQTSFSWSPLWPSATRLIPKVPSSTCPSAPSWTSSLRSWWSWRASWRPPVRGFLSVFFQITPFNPSHSPI